MRAVIDPLLLTSPLTGGRSLCARHDPSVTLSPYYCLQAYLAGDLVALLQHHGQSIDPNLVKLAEAWQQVQASLTSQGEQVLIDLPARNSDDDADDGDDDHAAEKTEDMDSAAGQHLIAEDLHVSATLHPLLNDCFFWSRKLGCGAAACPFVR